MSMNEKASPLVVWHCGQVSQVECCKLLNQHPATIWLTGLSADGKSTLAYALERALVIWSSKNGHSVKSRLPIKKFFSKPFGCLSPKYE
jgi:hypothetical protein